MRKFILLGAVAGLFVFSGEKAEAGVVAKIDLSSQTMTVSVNGVKKYRWRVSSGRRGFRTPLGRYRPTRMYRRYFSKKYNNSPMPNSIFFRGGYAIHGTYSVKSLGRPASHGCVRLLPTNAKLLYSLVRRYGSRNTRILIQN